MITATCTETNEESVFIVVDEEVITVMDNIVEEHKCKSKACNVVTESSYTERVYGSPKLQKDIEKLTEFGVPEKTHNQTKWAIKVWTEWVTSRNRKLLAT